jgi:hypothetical protein
VRDLLSLETLPAGTEGLGSGDRLLRAWIINREERGEVGQIPERSASWRADRVAEQSPGQSRS